MTVTRMTKIDMAKNIEIVTRGGKTDTFPFSSSVIALGTFDGVHIAHKRLLDEAVRLKSAINAEAVGAWCFYESPGAILRGEETITLSGRQEKLELLFDAGVDFVAIAEFEDFRTVSAEDFVNDILISSFRCIGTVSGYDHRFGHRGLGDAALLEKIFGKERTVQVERITLGGETVSSSAIRYHLAAGEISLANKMLGRALSFSSEIVSGKKLGRKLGFPTANQPIPRGLVGIRHGVYATRCNFGGGSSYIGVSNIGIRPSIDSCDNHALNCETYLIGFSGELYGKTMTVELCKYIREEMRFNSLEELTEAIERDRQSAIAFFSRQEK